MITVVDYRMGNLHSIVNMLKRAGFAAELSSSPEAIARAERLIIPGVGAYDAGMTNLAELGLVDVLRHKALVERTPVLGICLGMQLLLEGSEEGKLPGLGWVAGRCVRFRLEDRALKVPHMGWNEVRPTRRDTLFRDLADDAAFYFVHSYHAVCEDVLGWTTHGVEFPAAIQKDNVFGTQFHPEKSHKHGMRLLAAFAELRC